MVYLAEAKGAMSLPEGAASEMASWRLCHFVGPRRREASGLLMEESWKSHGG